MKKAGVTGMTQKNIGPDIDMLINKFNNSLAL
jgi:hypothetical protein